MTMPRNRRHARGPWQIEWRELRQVPGKGVVASRPRILDAAGKAVRLSHPGNAVLMAAAPALYELLEEVTEQAEFYLLMLKAEHPGMAAAAPLAAARKLLAEIRLGLL
jgi:hypothetical protein